MKKLIILAIILAAGLSVYPQATKTEQETKNEKTTVKKESAARSSGKAAQQQKANAVQQQQRSNAAQQEQQKANAVQQQQQQQQKANAVQQQQRSNAAQQQQQQQKTNAAQQQQQQQKANAVQQQQQQQKANTVQQQQQQKANAVQQQQRSDAVQQQQQQQKANAVQQQQQQKANAVQQQQQQKANAVQQQQQQKSNQAATQSRTQVDTKSNQNQAGNIRPARIQRPADPVAVRINTSSANRVYREGKGTLTLNDGKIIRHQNDQVFTKNTYNVNYDNPQTLRSSDGFRKDYNQYNSWYDYRVIRNINVNPDYRPMSMELRRQRNVYREPMHYNLIWTPFLFNRFMYYYPDQDNWDIDYGNEIQTISAYDVMNHIGSVSRVYGRVQEVYYSREDENYTLYIGDRFPYQDLSIVIPRSVVRQKTQNPEWYFNNRDIWAIGLIDLWEGKPEMIIRDSEQIRRY